MRPIKLKLRAFASYAKEQVIDFRELGDRNFFLIHGPTGAGKTSILDGISFALYGDTSGEDRTGKQMRSDHSKPGMLTEVTFDFSIGRDIYRITRRPEQERPKKRGGGTTTEHPKATLWKRTGLTDDSDEGNVIATQYSEATEKIEEILGFHSDQFRQVVMLPQGKFQKFLESKSDTREQILEILFRTEIYRQIQEAMKNRGKQIEDDRKHTKERRDILLDNAEASSPEELAERRTAEETRSSKLHAEVERLKAEEIKAQKELTEGNRIVTVLKEKDDAEKALKTLEARTDEFKQKRKRLDQAGKALPLMEIESDLDRRKKEAKDAQRKLYQTQENLLKAREANEEAERNLAKEKDREPERDKLSKRINQLEELKIKVGRLIESRKALAVAEGEIKRVTAERDNAQKSLDECRKKIDETRKTHLDAEKEAAKLEGLKKAVIEAKRNYEQRKQLDDLGKELDTAQKEHDRAKRGLTLIEKSLSKEREALGSMEEKWIKGQASVLAQELKPDEPCPVCGSTEHPAPAHYDETLPKEADINEKRELVKKLEGDRDKAQKAESKVKTGAARLESKVSTLEENLGNLKDEEFSALENKLREAEEAKNNAEAAKETVGSLGKGIEKLKTTETQVNQTLTMKGKELEGAIGAQAKVQGVVADLETGIPKDLQDPTAVDKAKGIAERSLKVLKDALEEAQRNATKTSKALSASETALKEASGALEKAVKQEKTTSDRFNAEITRVGFTNAEEYQSIKLTSEVIDKLDGEIRTYDGNLEAARDRYKRVGKTAKGLEMPDIETLEGKAVEAKAAHEKLVREETALNEQIKQIKKWLKELGSIAKEFESLDKQYAVMGRIAEVANGKNPLRMTFQRFVLATMLDNVLVAASKRLKIMSKGRFQLQRTVEQLDRRSSGGLDLEVFDAYTGTIRSVSTLSGGEGFLASLSLALGLADVVQSYTGGIYLDTLFIDEGFGSLDSEALDLAIQTLRDLQTGGRMVAIISHVSDLKERISARLEVSPSRTGSTARFVVG
jgi:exonuclease SbcC